MKTEATRCLAALLLAGISLAGCETTSSEFSTAFTGTPTTSLDDTQIQLRGTTEGTTANFLPRMKPEEASILASVRPQILDAKSPLQCVPFARDASGIMLVAGPDEVVQPLLPALQ